jgi:phosphoribosylformylglycinamidine synthase
MAEACRALDFPVVSGNVSLYNETNGAAIPPTPTVGGVGLIADYARRADFASLKPGDTLVLIGETQGWLGASMYLREVLGREEGAPPPVDLARERRTGDLVRGLIHDDLTACVHDLSDGGLVAAAVEMALASDCGLALMLQADAPDHAALFGEDQTRYLIALPQDRLDDLDARAEAAGVPYEVVGRAGGDEVSVSGHGGLLAAIQLTDLRRAHEAWLPAYMGE